MVSLHTMSSFLFFSTIIGVRNVVNDNNEDDKHSFPPMTVAFRTHDVTRLT